MRNSFRSTFLTLVFFASITRGQTTAPAKPSTLTLTASPAGALQISLDGKSVAAGRWDLVSADWQASVGTQIPIGSMTSTSAVQLSPTHVVATETFEQAKCVTDLALDGEDLHISSHVQNLNQTHALKKIGFEQFAFDFNHDPQGTIPSWFWTYLQAQGLAIYHPGLRSPVGAVYAHNLQWGFSAFSPSEFDQMSLICARWRQNAGIPAHCEINFYTERSLQPGQATDVDIVFRITRDLSLAHLLGAYKQVYSEHFPTLLHHADHRPIAQYACTGQVHVSPTNPLGYDGAMRRFDYPNAVSLYVRLIAPPLHEANALGEIFWDPGGFHPPMYQPDFDQFPDSVKANLPTLVAGFKKYGLRVGLCARCGDGITRAPGKDPVIYRLDASNAQQMKTLMNRFRNVMQMGFDMFYLDSFGSMNPNDQEILKQIRTAVGPDVLLYTEYCSDMSLPYADHYCEWQKDGLLFTTAEQFASLRLLCPGATWLSQSRTNLLYPPEYASMNLVPLVYDTQSNRLRVSPPTH